MEQNWNPISRNLFKTFKDKTEKLDHVKNETIAFIEVGRNIIETLLSFVAKTDGSIDFKNAFKYSLFPIPLSLAHSDKNRRETIKSNLSEVILDLIDADPKLQQFDQPTNKSQH